MARRFRVYCVTIGWAFGWALLQAQAPENTRTTIAGTVVNSATGQPIAGALVIADIGPNFAIDSQAKEERAVTDATGRFSFETERATAARLRVSRQGYRSESNLDEALTAILPDTGDAAIKLVPQSVITGRVISSDGEPLSGINVEAVLINVADGRRQFRENYASQETDDRGEYRMWNIPPGPYYVKLAGRTSMRLYVASTAGFDLGDEAYGPLYYPSAPSRDAAQIVRLQGGETISASFRVEGHRAYQISGKIVNGPAQRPFMIRLLRGADPAGNRASVNMAAQTFQVADVTPGTYTLQIYTSDPRPVWVGEVPVTVTDRDLTGVYVTMTGGFDVQARVESGGELQDAFVYARRSDSTAPTGAATTVYATSNQDGTYSLGQMLPGKYEISLDALGDRYVSSIRASGGIDVLTEGLTVTAGGAPNLTITLMPGGGTITGTVEGSAAPWQLLLTRSLNSTLIYQTTPTFAGRFEAASLAPGEYTLYAFPASHPLEFRNPAVLSALSQYGISVKVGDGETKEVTIKPIPVEALP